MHIEGMTVTPIRMIDLIDFTMTLEFILNGPAPQVAPPPVFKIKRAKPAITGLMVEHGKVRGVGLCVG